MPKNLLYLLTNMCGKPVFQWSQQTRYAFKLYIYKPFSSFKRSTKYRPCSGDRWQAVPRPSSPRRRPSSVSSSSSAEDVSDFRRAWDERGRSAGRQPPARRTTANGTTRRRSRDRTASSRSGRGTRWTSSRPTPWRVGRHSDRPPKTDDTEYVIISGGWKYSLKTGMLLTIN